MSTVSVPHRLGLFIQSTNGQLDKSGTGTGKGKGTGTGTGRGASPGPQCHNGKANDRRKMTVAMLKNVTTTTTPMPAYVCVCVSLFCSCVRCLVRELRKFFCYLNHVSLSKQHLPIQARQQLPHLLPRLLQRPEAVATVSLPSFFLLLLVLLCALWPQTSRRSLFLASCQVAISSRKNICAPFASPLLLLLLLSLLLSLLLLSLCNFRCVLREHKTFHRSIRNC